MNTIVLFIIAGIALLSAAPIKQPHLVFDRKSVQLDTMTQGETKEILFKFKNTGNANLVIDHTRSSCGCTIGFSTQKQILPDSGGTITIKFSSLQFRGSKIKYLYVFSNDPTQPVDTLTLNVFVRSEIDCTPRNVSLIDVAKGIPVTTVVAFYNPGTSPITLTNLTSPDRFIKYSLVKPVTIMPNDTSKISITIIPPDSAKSFTGSIGVFTTGKATDHPFSIKVYGKYK